MGHYKSNLRDLEFTLFEVLRVQDRMGVGPFAEMDSETACHVLAEVDRLARGPLSDSFVESDRHPPTFDPETHSVVVPESFKQSYQALWDGEWYRVDLPTDLGGYGAPATLRWAASELMLGANPFESNGSLMTAPDIPGRLRALRKRGGKLVVVDPRRTKTA